MSNSSWLNCEGFAISTPSISTATEGSLLRAWEMPRTTMNDVPWFCVCTIVMFGVSVDEILRPLDAGGRDLLGGEDVDRDRHVEQASSRLRAVTMISSRPSPSSITGCACTFGRGERAAPAEPRHGSQVDSMCTHGSSPSGFELVRARCGRLRPSPASFRTQRRAAGTSCRSRARRRCSRPRRTAARGGCAPRPVSGVSAVMSARSMHAEHDLLAARAAPARRNRDSTARFRSIPARSCTRRARAGTSSPTAARE